MNNQLGDRVEYTANSRGERVQGFVKEVDYSKRMLLVKPDDTVYKELVWIHVKKAVKVRPDLPLLFDDREEV